MDWNLIISIVSLIISSLLTIGIFWVGAKASKIDQLESRLEETARRHIDDRFRSMQDQCNMRHGSLDKRLESGDRHFQESREAEKEMARDIADIRENMATRSDLKDLSLKIDGLNNR